MKVFWASIEYKYKVNPVKGGFVYVFVKANSETDAYERITKEFQYLKLSISVLEFLIQYDKNKGNQKTVSPPESSGSETVFVLV